MEPIINPWLIYLVRVVGNVHTISILSCYPLTVITVLLGIAMVCDEEEDKRLQRYFVKAYCVLGVLLLIGILSPSHDTLLQMIIASYITPDNVILTKEEILKCIVDIKAALLK